MSRTDTQELERLMNKMKPVIIGMTPHWVYPSMAEWVTNGGTAKKPLTSTAWNGGARSTTAKTLINLSTVFGVPAGVKAVLVQTSIRDSGSAAGDPWLMYSPNDVASSGINWDCGGVTNDTWKRSTSFEVPCDENGDIYYQINATGASTMDVYLTIWGYYL